MGNAAQLADLVATSQALRATRARLEKRGALVALFARLDPADLRLAASYLAGEIPQGRLQVGWSLLQDAMRTSPGPMPLFESQADVSVPLSPTLQDLDRAFDQLRAASGPGAARRRRSILEGLARGLPTAEQRFLRGLLLAEMRHGALRAVVLEALASTLAVDIEALRRAVMFSGSLGEVVESLAREGEVCLPRFVPRPGVPIEPMLAAQAEDLQSVLADLGGRAAVEWKLDGVRVQLHRDRNTARVFSRQLRDVTALAPEAVELVQRLQVESVILDGEVVGQDAAGRPLPFQDLMSRFSSEKERALPARKSGDLFQADVPDASERDDRQTDVASVVAVCFDVLQLDGKPLVDTAYAARRGILERLIPEASRVPQRLVDNVTEAQAMYDEALRAGHEGVVLKSVDAPYTAGRRGAAWRKFKPAVTLDLVILAAEWGHGRRRGLLSNIHLGARDDDDPQKFHMLGKTFKGLTDSMLRKMTDDLLELETGRAGHVVHVRPVHVVEIAFDVVQRSPRYPSGFALRFARVKSFRPDKSPRDANTLADIRLIHARPR
jgi:DNA ligase-1